MRVCTDLSGFPTLRAWTTKIVSVEDYERVARAALPPEVLDYFAGGAGEEWSLRNRAAFGRWIIRPRVLLGMADAGP